MRSIHPAGLACAGLAWLAVACLVQGCSRSHRSAPPTPPPAPCCSSASGALALDYLRATPYTSLLVEVDYVQGAAPTPAALALLETRLGERCDKPAGVTVTLDDAIPDPGIAAWSVTQIRDLERAHRDAASGGTQAVLYVLYLNGASDQDTSSAKVLGISYAGPSFCVFQETISAVAAPAIGLLALERAVLVHEAGHNLGLVDNGVAMVTPHLSSAAHDSNPACVMYEAISSSAVAAALGAIPDQYDAECIADLVAAGGK